MTIRLFPKIRLTPEELVAKGSFSPQILDHMRSAMICKANIIISGGTGSGKTTLLNVLGNFIPDQERIVIIEDTKELQIDKPHLISLEAANRQIQAEERITMARLLKNALRMRPDRIAVGELRDADAATAFLQAINTGHSGVATTIHANSVDDALLRLDVLATGAGDGLPFEAIQQLVRANIDMLIHVERTPLHGRRVTQVSEVVDRVPRRCWQWDYEAERHVGTFDGATMISERLKRFTRTPNVVS